MSLSHTSTVTILVDSMAHLPLMSALAEVIREDKRFKPILIFTFPPQERFKIDAHVTSRGLEMDISVTEPPPENPEAVCPNIGTDVATASMSPPETPDSPRPARLAASCNTSNTLFDAPSPSPPPPCRCTSKTDSTSSPFDRTNS
ncbi:hypothetical protein QPK87_02085 [Kamptonema cortianum]|nr:hypothetical protein [Kamptonema cortianum]MDL5046124.1 hypothetical protein [Oscillatoria amoena NRMC-F 0135]